ncbi:MAG: hypothetical protein HUU20_21165 [Pirellulales bacterium]|nr:hypothetical protein [Pirellulales bacterium]
MAAEAARSDEPLAVGDQLQLFLDDHLIDSMRGVELKLHSPRPAEIVIQMEKPWEDQTMYDPVVLKDGDRYRMWYRTNFNARPFFTGYAESADGIHWTRPNLGLIEFRGSKENNLVWTSGTDGSLGCVLSVFQDGNPNAPAGERYKAFATRITEKAEECGILGLVSPDGLRWQLVQPDLILRGGAFDSHNLALWDAARGQYLAYTRGFGNGIRLIRRAASNDFRTWSELAFVDLGDSPVEHLYKNAATAYYRRPDILLMFPKRFLPERKADPKWPYNGLSDIVFMSSRDGVHWDRRFMEAFLRPGPDELNWHERAIEVGQGLVPTGQGEMSLYYVEHYRTGSVRIRRGVLREDGLVSVHAPYAGGELVTRPVVFTGKQLAINYATSAAGSVRVEILDTGSKTIAGFGPGDAAEIYGDQPERVVAWKQGADLSGLAGKPVRLRFFLKDADLYSFRFRAE